MGGSGCVCERDPPQQGVGGWILVSPGSLCSKWQMLISAPAMSPLGLLEAAAGWSGAPKFCVLSVLPPIPGWPNRKQHQQPGLELGQTDSAECKTPSTHHTTYALPPGLGLACHLSTRLWDRTNPLPPMSSWGLSQEEEAGTLASIYPLLEKSQQFVGRGALVAVHLP